MTHELLKTKRAIIWDWNGTLLNDTDLCLNCMNSLLTARELKMLNKNQYKDIFTFPVKDYYEQAGFDFSKENFEIPATEFIELYYKELHQADLHSSVTDVLEKVKEKGLHQSILSAMEHVYLLDSLKSKGVYHFFDEVSGINNHYAHSKQEIGLDLVNKLGFEKDEILIIGDTLHDLEVAEGLGVDILLIANGHQSRDRLEAKTPNVIDRIEEVLNIL